MAWDVLAGFLALAVGTVNSSEGDYGVLKSWAGCSGLKISTGFVFKRANVFIINVKSGYEYG